MNIQVIIIFMAVVPLHVRTALVRTNIPYMLVGRTSNETSLKAAAHSSCYSRFSTFVVCWLVSGVPGHMDPTRGTCQVVSYCFF